MGKVDTKTSIQHNSCIVYMLKGSLSKLSIDSYLQVFNTSQF